MLELWKLLWFGSLDCLSWHSDGNFSFWYTIWWFITRNGYKKCMNNSAHTWENELAPQDGWSSGWKFDGKIVLSNSAEFNGLNNVKFENDGYQSVWDDITYKVEAVSVPRIWFAGIWCTDEFFFRITKSTNCAGIFKDSFSIFSSDPWKITASNPVYKIQYPWFPELYTW